MEALADFLAAHSIYFTFFSFAYLLASIFTFLLGLFLVTLSNRSKSTSHLGVLFLWLAIFNLSYIATHAYYGPYGAFHRWVTVGTILLPNAHMLQWIFKFPDIRNLIFSRVVFVIQYLVSFLFFLYFINLSFDAGYKFLFTGHMWDFRADEFSSRFGAVIVLYILFFIIASVWRAVVEQGKDRWSIIMISAAFVVISIVPAVLNVLSRDGVYTRGAFIFTYVLMGVFGYFLVLIAYLNRTRDRTTFMVKIVGISLVTFLLLMQFLSLSSLNDREASYDELHVEYANRAVEGGERHSDIEYIISYADGDYKLTYQTADPGVDFNEHSQDWNNTVHFEKINAMAEIGFREALLAYLKSITEQPFFSGYRDALIRYVTDAEMEGPDLKAAVLEYIKDDLNTIGRVNTTKLEKINVETNPEKLDEFLDGDKANVQAFLTAMKTHLAGETDKDPEVRKKQMMRFFSPFYPARTRHYRKAVDEDFDHYKHFTSFIIYKPVQDKVYEVGFSYRVYRKYIHVVAFRQIVILFGVLLVLVVIFPFFFRGSLLNPLNSLVRGIRKVNKGDLSVRVPIHVQDEIGFLAESFNKMVISIADAQEKLQDYAHNLEEKVSIRTAELNETLENVKKLKTQQDGDYFLTALLQKPLNYNANKSRLVTTELYLEQKKKFDFRNKHSDLGGDLCVTGNLRLGTANDYRRYVVALNADAMGKSMQGAGGALVLGVVMNSIMSRSAKGDRILDSTPEQWLTEVYEEIHGVFLAFNGSMVISCVLAMVDEQSGDMWYFNAEHPFQVLYRNKAASFIEEELRLRKVGLESEFPFSVFHTRLQPGDVVLMGSDGRDDINTAPPGEYREINDDEFLFLKRVEEADGSVEGIIAGLKDFGEITDDLSLVRIGFHEAGSELSDGDELPVADRTVIDIDLEDEGALKRSAPDAAPGTFEELLEQGKNLAQQGRHAEALQKLNAAYEMNSEHQVLRKMMAVLTFKEKDYERAIHILEQYLQEDNELVDFWLYLSIAHKHAGDADSALEAAQRVYEMSPERVVNLVNIADLYLKRGNKGLAREFLEKALELDPDNRQARSISEQLAG
ncbi:MAG: SpoIIE family protein phosphatase [Leptospiraceae bacterium]|nr:SpoIIE family protein phosphatase [Leptospiraceae bacterium]